MFDGASTSVVDPVDAGEAGPPPLSAVARLALLLKDPALVSVRAQHQAKVWEFLGVVNTVGGQEQALRLRSARLLAYARTRDLAEEGFSSWTAFAKEHSPWRGSRTRDFVRFAESRLDAIKDAVSNNVIDMKVAMHALRALGPDAPREAQLAFLAEATFAVVPTRHRAFMDVLSGDEMRRVIKARSLATTLIGWEAPVRAVDAFILDCHARKLSGQEIHDRARAVPPKPERLGKTVPDWKDDPATSLLGPWVEPTSLRDAIAKLRAIEVVLDQRRVLLAKAYWLIRHCHLWNDLPGCNSLADLCIVHLEISQRTFQRYWREGLHHDWFPEVEKEIAAGRITADRAMFAMARGGESTIEGWMELARRLGRGELERAVQAEKERDVRLDQAYAPAVAVAREVEGVLNKVKEATQKATTIGESAAAMGLATAIGGTVGRIATHLLAVGATGPVQVALRDDVGRRSPARAPDHLFAPPGLLAAADYLLAVGQPARQSGVRKVVERDGWVCQNPRCRRRTLRVHVHHVIGRQHGGTDHPANTLTGCPACHLRLIHGGKLSVVRFENWLVWVWPDGSSAIMDSPVAHATEAASTTGGTMA